MAGLEEQLCDLDDVEARDDEQEREVEALRVQKGTLETTVAAYARRVKCLADHLGANVDDYHLGLDKYARKEEAAKAMT